MLTLRFKSYCRAIAPNVLFKMSSSSSGAGVLNRLQHELSPYLLQHKANPVDWYPWGQEAFRKAKEEKKMIFLSIGYSTCHWCHVMERESFESHQVAKIMNDNFVNVKVDREERPDVDKVYMTFVQATTGGGGWPLSLFLTPELKPVFGGTYFPPVGNFGRPSFPQLLTALSGQWEDEDNREEMLEAGSQVLSIIDNRIGPASQKASSSWPQWGLVDKFYAQISSKYDPEFGGFSKAPKFPQPSNIMTLFRLQSLTDVSQDKKKRSLEMVLKTLEMMDKGGIHDHISKGFARYSTDREWHVPHFEKMLYDQAQLIAAYSVASAITKDPHFLEVVDDIVSYVQRDLKHASGGFFSAEDADSHPLGEEGGAKKEGAFCVWGYQEVKDLLGGHKVEGSDLTMADVVIDYFNVKEGGNVNPHGDPHGELKGKNVLTMLPEKSPLVADQEILKSLLSKSKQIMFDERLKRPRPGLDDKILTSWNGLLISSLARAGSLLGRSDLVDLASNAADFVLKNLWNSDTKRLGRSIYGAGHGSSELQQLSHPIEGFIDDYCFMVLAFLDLYHVTLDMKWLLLAKEVQGSQDSLFLDKEKGGYFTSKEGDPEIVIRLKDDQDGAEPSSNSVSAMNLLRLGRLLGTEGKHYQTEGEKILKLFSSTLEKMPMALPAMVEAFMFNKECAEDRVLFITGDKTSHPLLSKVKIDYLPNLCMIHVSTEDKDTISKMHPLSEGLSTDNHGSFISMAGSLTENITSIDKLNQLL